MQPPLMLLALPVVISFTLALAIQDGSSQNHFMSHAELTAVGSFNEAVREEVARLRNSWLTRPENETLAVMEHATEAHLKTGENDVPARRKGMYFRPVSVTLQCVMSLTIGCLLVYTFLSLSRNYDELSASFTPSIYTQMLTIGARTSSFAPMLCMLFVACRMYILATTEGLGEPPPWVKTCMWTAVAGVVLQLLVVFTLPSFSKKHGADEAAYDMTEGKQKAWDAEHHAVHDDTIAPTQELIIEDVEGGAKQAVTDAVGEQNDVHPDLNRIEFKKDSTYLQTPFWCAQTLSMLCIYGSVTGVIVGINTFPAQTTKISAAVNCTINMSMLYFGVCFLLWVARAISEPNSPFTNAALCMSTTVRKAPMFAVLFLASRMRALQLDPPYGMPPPWMQHCFYGITVCLYLEAFVGAYVGFSGQKAKAYYGVYIFRCPSSISHLANHAFALISYGLLIPIVVGVIAMESTSGAPAPLSTTLKCVIDFTTVYFSVMFLQDLILFVEEVEKVEMPMLRDTAVSAGISLGLAPLLCILFVATRMRALQITQQMGAPPGWAQDCMIIAVFATCVQSVCCLVMPIFIGNACEVDEDGNPDYDLKPMVGAYAVAVVKYVALIALHGSVVAICVSVYVMTPDNAHDGGRFLNDRKQFFKAIAITLVIFCIALLFSSAKVIGMAIKFAIESADKELLGVDITIKKCALNLFKGYVQVSRLVVHNPVEEIVYERNAEGKIEGKGKLTGKLCEWKSDCIAKVDLLLIKVNVGRIITTLGKEFELENLSLKGIYFNVEKPDTNLKAQNSNVEYIVNHLDALGLIPPPDATPAEEPKKDEPKKDEPKKPEEKPVEPKKAEEPKPPADPDIPMVIIHKIALGDIGAGVLIRNVSVIGQISFHPSIGLIEFDDVQKQIFNGKEDLKPEEMVACIAQAIAKHVFHSVTEEIPKQLQKALLGAPSALLDAAKGAVKKMPCGA